VSDQPLDAVYLITGTDLPKIALALRRLRGRFPDSGSEHLFGESASGRDAVAALNALGLFGGQKLVLVEGIERWKQTDADEVIAYLAGPTPGATLAVVGDPSRLTGLEQACAVAGAVLRFDLPLNARKRLDYPKWVRAQLERVGVSAAAGVAERLVELVGEDAFSLESEVEKLAAWAGSDTVDVRDVEALATPTGEASTFALVDAWGARDVAGALAACEAMRATQEPFLVAVRLAGHIQSVRRVQALVEQDVAVRTIASTLRLKEFPARKQASQATNFSREELEAAVVRLAELDVAVKGGSRLDPDLELELAIVDVTAHRGD